MEFEIPNVQKEFRSTNKITRLTLDLTNVDSEIKRTFQVVIGRMSNMDSTMEKINKKPNFKLRSDSSEGQNFTRLVQVIR